MRHSLFAALMVVVALVSACGDKKEVAEKPATANVAAPVPDVGKVENVKVTAQGFGASEGEAVSEAMKMAILQVNGAAIQTSSITAKYGLDVTLNKDSASLRANGFAEVVKERSGGVIQNFKLIELQEPSLIPAFLIKFQFLKLTEPKFKPQLPPFSVRPTLPRHLFVRHLHTKPWTASGRSAKAQPTPVLGPCSAYISHSVGQRQTMQYGLRYLLLSISRLPNRLGYDFLSYWRRFYVWTHPRILARTLR